MQKFQRIYLDYAAGTPVDPLVMKAMMPYFSHYFGNPSSTHWDGQQASAAVFNARQIIARAVGVDYQDIIFTGSATEANNLAMRGAVDCFFKNMAADKTDRMNKTHRTDMLYRIIISAIEHESVMGPCRVLEKELGVEVVKIPVNHDGIIDLQKLKDALNEQTILVSMQYVNSEIGVIQPIQKIAKIIRDFSITLNPKPFTPYPLFHVDAVQAFQFFPCRADELGVDIMTLSAHKIYGPKGVGALCIRNQVLGSMHIAKFLLPAITGGGQEHGLRAGTEQVPGIVGFGKAVEVAEKVRKKESARLILLRDYLWNGIQKIIPDAEINGSHDMRVPHIVNVYFPGRSAQDLVIELDVMGIAVSPGTACSSRIAEPSPVIGALGLSSDRPSSSLRFSLGRPTTKRKIDAVLTLLQKRFKK